MKHCLIMLHQLLFDKEITNIEFVQPVSTLGSQSPVSSAIINIKVVYSGKHARNEYSILLVCRLIIIVFRLVLNFVNPCLIVINKRFAFIPANSISSSPTLYIIYLLKGRGVGEHRQRWSRDFSE